MSEEVPKPPGFGPSQYLVSSKEGEPTAPNYELPTYSVSCEL